MSDTSGSRGMRIAAVGVLIAWVGALLAAVVTAGVGVAGLAGWSDSFVQRVELVPGTSASSRSTSPRPGRRAAAGRSAVRSTSTTTPPTATASSSTTARTSPRRRRAAGRRRPPERRPHRTARLRRRTGLEPAHRLAVRDGRALAAGRRAHALPAVAPPAPAAQGEPFTDHAVRRLRTMGALLLGWELLEPVLWLFLSPKAWDYSDAELRAAGLAALGSMEPGGPS